MLGITPKNSFALLPLMGVLLLTLLLGYLLGRMVTVRFSVADVRPTALQEDNGSGVPVVSIEGIEDGKLVGTLHGEVRLWVGEEQVFASEDGTFSVKPGPFLVNSVSVLVPDGMRYVASKRGKKYYSVTEAGGQTIVPENRVYFRTASVAEAAGYVR